MNETNIQSTDTPTQHEVPDTNPAITHKFNVAGYKGYCTVGLSKDGTPCQIFITMAMEGSTLGGTMRCFARIVSLALQHGLPLEELVNEMAYQRYEPSGFTIDKEIPEALSIIDYIFRWLGYKFIPDFKEKDKSRKHSGLVT